MCVCVHACLGAAVALKVKPCAVLLNARGSLLARSFAFVLTFKWARAKFGHLLHKAAARGCRGLDEPGLCHRHRESLMFQEKEQMKWMPSLSRR